MNLLRKAEHLGTYLIACVLPYVPRKVAFKYFNKQSSDKKYKVPGKLFSKRFKYNIILPMCIFLLFPSEIYKGCNSFQIHTNQIYHAEILRQSFSLLLALKERNENKCQHILRVDGIFSKMMLLMVLVY